MMGTKRHVRDNGVLLELLPENWLNNFTRKNRDFRCHLICFFLPSHLLSVCLSVSSANARKGQKKSSFLFRHPKCLLLLLLVLWLPVSDSLPWQPKVENFYRFRQLCRVSCH
jgi:hypothetical protein